MAFDLSQTTAAKRHAQIFKKYIAVNKRTIQELAEKKGGDVAYKLYDETQKAAPTAQEIQSKAQSLGYKIKRGFTNGVKRTIPQEIAARIAGIRFVASGWLPAVRRLSKSQPSKVAAVASPRGSVTIETDSNGKFRTTLTNGTKGIAVVAERLQLGVKALNEASRDMIKYIRAKRAGLSGKNVGG